MVGSFTIFIPMTSCDFPNISKRIRLLQDCNVCPHNLSTTSIAFHGPLRVVFLIPPKLSSVALQNGFHVAGTSAALGDAAEAKKKEEAVFITAYGLSSPEQAQFSGASLEDLAFLGVLGYGGFGKVELYENKGTGHINKQGLHCEEWHARQRDGGEQCPSIAWAATCGLPSTVRRCPHSWRTPSQKIVKPKHIWSWFVCDGPP